jgi:hypothetical protein
VIFAGRKVSIPKPRLRAKGGRELTLKSYRAFQQDGRMQRAVGQWKAGTAAELRRSLIVASEKGYSFPDP